MSHLTEEGYKVINAGSSYLLQDYLWRMDFVKKRPSKTELINILAEDLQSLIRKRISNEKMEVRFIVSNPLTIEVSDYTSNYTDMYTASVETFAMMIKRGGRMKKYIFDKTGKVIMGKVDDQIVKFGQYISSAIALANTYLEAACKTAYEMLIYNGFIVVDRRMFYLLEYMAEEYKKTGKVSPEMHIIFSDHLTKNMRMHIDSEISECYIDIDLSNKALPITMDSITYNNLSGSMLLTIVEPEEYYEHPYAVSHFTCPEEKLEYTKIITAIMDTINTKMGEYLQ